MLFSPDIKSNTNITDNVKNIGNKLPIIIPVIGMSIISLAAVSYVTELPLSDLFVWLDRFFSSAFIVIYTLLVALGIYAIVQLKQPGHANYWQEVGLQAGNSIATLALTFTLLGISLGIGTLSEQPLSPENVQAIISGLTKQFSMAFMTTVIGLPTATILRALISIKYQKIIGKNETDIIKP
ncbi:MAG: hypothetical protein MJK15_06035 [Colwellia sp.]|nr:hypothetical protein [Colwellia sp.]